MAISPVSHAQTRSTAAGNSGNYTGNAPLPTTQTKGDAIQKGIRPSFPPKNPQASKSISANSIYIRSHIPVQQAGLPLKEIHAPTANGFSRDSVLNLLVAGNQNNLDRQGRAVSEQGKKTQENSIERKQAGL